MRNLRQILSVRNIESAELGDKAKALRLLMERWACPGPDCDVGLETITPK